MKLQVTRYRGAHDHEGRWAIEIDGIEVAGLGCISAHAAEGAVRKELAQQRLDGSSGHLWDDVGRVLRADGRHTVPMFHESTREFLQLSVADARTSPDVVVRSLALLDRRFGKRSLRALLATPPTQPLERACFRLRIEAEGLQSVGPVG